MEPFKHPIAMDPHYAGQRAAEGGHQIALEDARPCSRPHDAGTAPLPAQPPPPPHGLALHAACR
jgi:hypothetical protein